MTRESLNSDELGEKGESRFRELCVDANLICNKSHRDRAGWDFIIDFPYSDQKERSLDNRIAPPSCYVQVKTILGSTRSVRLKLSMAERLAKVANPSFIYVIKITEQLTVSETYLIHMRGERLASVLKRLRRQTADGTTAEKLNNFFINFSPNDDERVEPTGAGLREALQQACGENPHAYLKAKDSELNSLGVEGARFEGRMRLTAKDRNELSEIYLGIRQSVPVQDFETFEKRFDIKIPDLTRQDARLTLSPVPADRVTVVVRGEDGLPPAVSEADLFVVPKVISGDDGRMQLRGHLYTVDLYHRSTGISPHFQFDIKAKLASAEAWWSFWRTLRAFSDNRGEIEIRPSKAKGIIQLDIIRTDFMPDYNFDNQIEICNALMRIFRLSGLGPVPDFEWNLTEHELLQISILDSLTQRLPEPIPLSGGLYPELEDFNGQQAILANMFTIGHRKVAYYALVTIAVKSGSAQSTVQLTDLNFRRAVFIDQNVDAFKDFCNDAKSSERIEFLCSLG